MGCIEISLTCASSQYNFLLGQNHESKFLLNQIRSCVLTESGPHRTVMCLVTLGNNPNFSLIPGS